ncbi:MAG: FAD-binding oxidoreductase [Actinomycetota bacterium]|nr:FAD-binding oxidoreductase [Actinomycetota bacterium]
MSALDELTTLLPKGAVSTDAADLDAHAIDLWPRALVEKRARSRREGPIVVVRPTDAAQISEILRWANSTRTPIVPYGNGSGVCGGIEPSEAIVVDLRQMNAIGEIDERSLLVTAQAGVTGPQVTDYLEQRGFMLGHEPQSLAISTVGGWLATRACGQLSARYGGIEDLVTGFEAVLADGRVVRHKAAPRRAAGPDVASLMIGSEGTLGVITRATLRVHHLTTEVVDRCLSFEHMADGVRACRLIAQGDLHPTLVRLYDPEDTALFMMGAGGDLRGSLLLLSFDGRDAGGRADAAVELSGGVPEDDAFVAHWWAHRNDAVDTFQKTIAGQGLLGPHGLVDTMEVAGTWSVLRDLYHLMKEALGGVAEFVGCHLSHVYPDGGCLYFTMGSACEDDDTALKTNNLWWETGMRACLDAGGSISHHHGIGRLKAPWLDEEMQGWREVLVAVKKAIDPLGIMNPGALGL